MSSPRQFCHSRSKYSASSSDPWRHADHDVALANPAVVAARSLLGNPGADQRADDAAAHRAAGQRCRDGAHRQQPDPRQRDDARRGEAGENGAERAYEALLSRCISPLLVPERSGTFRQGRCHQATR